MKFREEYFKDDPNLMAKSFSSYSYATDSIVCRYDQ